MNGFNIVNNRVYQNTSTGDAPIPRNNGSYGVPDTMNVPSFLSVGTVTTPMGTNGPRTTKFHISVLFGIGLLYCKIKCTVKC